MGKEIVPYIWDERLPPPNETLQLWVEVGNKLDKESSVIWKKAVESLREANTYLRSSREARDFVETYMGTIVSILLEQLPGKVGDNERRCVHESLNLAAIIISKDLEVQYLRGLRSPSGNSNEVGCKTLSVLSCLLNKRKNYYKGRKSTLNPDQNLSGLPQIRLLLVEKFLKEEGFVWLEEYMKDRIVNVNVNVDVDVDVDNAATTILVASSFPSIEVLHRILAASLDSYNKAVDPDHHYNHRNEKISKLLQQATVDVSKTVMRYITSCSEESLNKICTGDLKFLLHNLHCIFNRFIDSRRDDTNEYYRFWRVLVLKLVTSQSLPLKLFGWQQIALLIFDCEDRRPPPRSFLVYDSGCSFVNGEYHFAGVVTEDGYAQSQNNDISYERVVPVDEPDNGGKKLTLFRVTMRSQKKWWFLSVADEEQPGTDRDIDYYYHKSKEHEAMEPPPSGWRTSRNAGIDPPPKLKRMGLMVPPGEECNTFKHQLEKWAIENKIIETLPLGDSDLRAIIATTVPCRLIYFLAFMSERDCDDSEVGTGYEGELSLYDAAHSIQDFRSVLNYGIHQFPNKIGICLLFTKNIFGYTSFQLACRKHGRDKVMNAVEDILILCTSSSSSDKNKSSLSFNYVEALITAAIDKNLHIDCLYFLLRRQPDVLMKLLASSYTVASETGIPVESEDSNNNDDDDDDSGNNYRKSKMRKRKRK